MSLYLYKPHPKAVEAEEGINMSLYLYNPIQAC